MLASGRTTALDVRIGNARRPQLEHPHGRFVSGNYFSRARRARRGTGRTLDATVDASPARARSRRSATATGRAASTTIRPSSARRSSSTVSKLTIVGIAPAEFTGEIVGAPTDIWLPLVDARCLASEPDAAQRSHDDLAPPARPTQARRDARSRREARLPTLIRQDIVANGGAGVRPRLSRGQTTDLLRQSGAKGFSRVRATFEAPLVHADDRCRAAALHHLRERREPSARARDRARPRDGRATRAWRRSQTARAPTADGKRRARVLERGARAAVRLVGEPCAARRFAAGGPSIRSTTDRRAVLGFTLVVSMLAVGLFGLAPALRASRVDLASTMRASAHAVAGSALGATRAARAARQTADRGTGRAVGGAARRRCDARPQLAQRRNRSMSGSIATIS